MLLISYLWAANRSFYLIPRCPSLLWPRRCATLGVVHTEGHWVRTELCSALFASCCRPLLPGATPTSGKLALRSRTSRKISGMALSSCYFWKSSQVSLNIFCRCYTHFVWAVDIYASVFFFVFFFFFKKSSLWNWLGKNMVLLAKKTFQRAICLELFFSSKRGANSV